jgi:hypothetical protein
MLISSLVYHFLGIFDITISLFGAVILSDVYQNRAIFSLSYHFLRIGHKKLLSVFNLLFYLWVNDMIAIIYHFF